MNVLLLGAGLVSKPLVNYLLNQKDIKLTIASRTKDKIDKLLSGHKNGIAQELDIQNEALLEKLIKESSLVISLLPYIHHVKVSKLCIKHRKNVVTTSYVSAEMKALDGPAKDAGIIILNEIGLDPGIDHMSAMRIIHNVQNKGGKVVSFKSYCGGLPAPEANTNPLGYKFSWSPRGVALAGRNTGKYLKDGKEVNVESKDLFTHTHPLKVGGMSFEAYVNRNSLPYVEIYGLSGIKTMFRGTLRNPGWCQTWKKIVDLKILDDQPRNDLKDISWKQWTSKLVPNSTPQNIEADTAKYLGLKTDGIEMKIFKWLDLFSDGKIPEQPTILDVFVAKLQEKMAYKPGERDMIVLYHDFIAEYKNKKEHITSTLIDYGIPNGDSSMSRTVSLPAAIATKLILNGKIKLTGVHIPVLPEIYNPVLDELETLGIKCKEETI